MITTRRGSSTAITRGRHLVQVLSHAVLEEGQLHAAVRLRYPGQVTEPADGFGCVAAAAHAADGGHAGVIPPGDVPVIHERA